MLVYTTLDGRGGTLVQPSMDKIRASFEVTSHIDCEFRDESNSTQSVNVECLTKIVDVIIRVTLRPSQFRNGYPKVAPKCRTLQVHSFRGYTEAQRSVRWQRGQHGRSDVRVDNTTMISRRKRFRCSLTGTPRNRSPRIWGSVVQACFTVGKPV